MSDNLEAVNPFDPAQFAVTATTAAMSTRKMLTHCRVGKPAKTAFVRASTRAEDSMHAAVLELKEEGETYLLAPNVAAELPGLAAFVSLTVSVDRQGNPFLWMVKQPGVDGRDNDWSKSMREAQAAARKRWIRVEANMGGGGYDVYEAAAGISEPVFPEHTLPDYLKVAFGEQNIIRDVTHPVIQRLLGAA
jgi:hypothetical protein